MRLAMSVIAGLSARTTLLRQVWLSMMAFFAVISAGAQFQQNPPISRFEGKVIPEPPGKDEPWTVPPTKLPRFLVKATEMLFDQGVADPRGCEYRQVEVGSGWTTKGHGFVLPERPDAPGRFVVCWDGLVYPAVTVGPPADLDRDINDLAASMRQAKVAEKARQFPQGVSWGFPRHGQDAYGIAGVNDHSPIKLCLLLRLARADLAETLFAAATAWKPEPRNRDLTNYGISYLTLASNWAGAAFGRLIDAHIRGEDVIALDAARRLVRFRDLATAAADAMGFPPEARQSRDGTGPAPHFYFLSQLDDLLRDHERRAKLPPREPIPNKAGDPSARIAALIRDLDLIDEQQMSSPGGASPGSSLLVHDLIAEGDAAVAPLLGILESDNRLTRSVSKGRGFSFDRFVHPVYEAAFAALIGILQTREFENQRMYGWKTFNAAERKALAASIRQFWEKTRSVPVAERWYRMLRDDSAGPVRWLEAAGGIVQPVVDEKNPYPKPGTGPFKGESLRAGKEPSVSELMLRRARQIEGMDNPQRPYEQGLAGACQMGSSLATWDGKASLPLLRELMKLCTTSDRATDLATFTETRVRQGDLDALDEYAAWLRTSDPAKLQYQTLQALRPLVAHRDHPALISAARWLFNDSRSLWVPLVPEARGQQPPGFQNLFNSPLMVVAGFREGVLAALTDRTPLGTVEKVDNRTIQYKVNKVTTTNYSSSNLDLDEIKIGVEFPYRRCDLLALRLSDVEGCPQIDLFRPEARRDESVAACIAFVKRHGALFTAEALPGVRDFPDAKPHLKFPTLGKPATRDDVAAARAIFSLEGQGEVRLASMPGFPQSARWLTLKDVPRVWTNQDGTVHREYDTDGYVWQAEEIRKGDHWERFYGFVGHHQIGRAPASEIEFKSQFGPWSNLEGGLDARTEMAESASTAHQPGRPILVTLQIRNRLGVNRSSPSEFLRNAADGKPALRRGVSLVLWRSAERSPGSGFGQQQPENRIEPRSRAHFDPGPAARELAPLESFDALRVDLNDWFDLSKPGRYHAGVVFTNDSGVGEGSSSQVYFQVGDAE
jgi:hypothetical protein